MGDTQRIVLLDEVTTNSDGPKVRWKSKGPGTLHIYGTWDTATVTIEGSSDGGTTWTAVENGVFTDDVITSFEAGRIDVRAVVSSVGGSTSLSAALVQQGRDHF